MEWLLFLVAGIMGIIGLRDKQGPTHPEDSNDVYVHGTDDYEEDQ